MQSGLQTRPMGARQCPQVRRLVWRDPPTLSAAYLWDWRIIMIYMISVPSGEQTSVGLVCWGAGRREIGTDCERDTEAA